MSFGLLVFFSPIVVILQMYSIQSDSNNSSYESMDCIRQEKLIFTNHQVIKTKQYYFSSAKLYDNKTKVPFYQSSRTFQKSRKGKL